MRALRACQILKQGGVIAHETATLPGISAHPGKPKSVQMMQRFKQRRGPFLLLADSISTALRQARFFSPALRKLARQSWPGPVTLIFAARPGLPGACYQDSKLAIRVDADVTTQRIAKQCGGLLLSSSLNRKGGAISSASRKTHLRWHRHFSGRITAASASGMPSTVLFVGRNGITTIRP